jgi:hypothetical protein
MGEKGMEQAPSRIGAVMPGDATLSRVAGASSMASAVGTGGLAGLRQTVGGAVGDATQSKPIDEAHDVFGQPPKG